MPVMPVMPVVSWHRLHGVPALLRQVPRADEEQCREQKCDGLFERCKVGVRHVEHQERNRRDCQ